MEEVLLGLLPPSACPDWDLGRGEEEGTL